MSKKTEIYRVAMEQTADANIAVFHSRTMITNLSGELCHRNGGDSLDDKEFSPVVQLVMELPGVEKISVAGPYTMHVWKGGLFSWEELYPKITDLMLAWHFTQCALDGRPDPVEQPLVKLQEGVSYRSREEEFNV